MNPFIKKLALFFFFLLLTIGIQWKGNSTRMIPFLDWYNGLNQPIWSVPNWLFAPFSSVLCILIAWVGYSFGAAKKGKTQERGLFLWALELASYGLWLFFFFTKRNLSSASLWAIGLILFTGLTLLHTWKISKLAFLFTLFSFGVFLYAAALTWTLKALN